MYNIKEYILKGIFSGRQKYQSIYMLKNMIYEIL